MIQFPSKVIDVEIPSDFIVVLTKATDAAGNLIDITTLPFYIEFILAEKKYICSFDGASRVNNMIVGNEVHLVFEKYKWDSCGRLAYRELEQFVDPEFSDGIKDVWTSGLTNINLLQWGA